MDNSLFLEFARSMTEAAREQNRLVVALQAECVAARAVLIALLDTHPKPKDALQRLLEEMDAMADSYVEAGVSPEAAAKAVAMYRDLLSRRAASGD